MPVDCDEADIEKLRSLGFSLDDVYDIITTASVYNYNNRVAEAAGHLPDRKSLCEKLNPAPIGGPSG